jgi:hypothetical protein
VSWVQVSQLGHHTDNPPSLCSLRFSASLAGLLWRSILSQKGIHVGRSEFVKANWIIVVVCMVVGVAVVVAEVCVIY